ncbi:acetyl-CoA acetyltransferase [Paraburkholderia sp. LEh10]|uniref:acetyl-CoA acetyltransferase n=1 Tax=Paraburkholderia sp. LEh10 TaxID=2821353 RepID=UPI001AE86AA4|nr:acetyl-CoA acetyltransferase [Paraburkholderia sp. LEh10]MBP0590454.1 acetyl-CoA acetyltransferase [Paraburkholderia sp. LEh10]
MSAAMIGWSHTKFGKLENETMETLIVRAARDAIADAGISFADVDEIYVSNFNAGMDPQGFPSSLVFEADDALRFKPSTRVENACASGSAAIHQGLNSIRADKAEIVLVVGVEKMTAATPEVINTGLVSASFVREEAQAGSFAGLFGKIATDYFERYGDQSAALARIAAKNHRNGSVNPLAHMQKDLGYTFCSTISDRNPLVAGPLRRTDCSMVSDGAAAIVLASKDIARNAKKAVSFRSAVQVNDFLPTGRRDMTRLAGCEEAWKRALSSAKLNLGDLSFVETHDCFTIAELMEYEAMGITPVGKGYTAIEEGLTEANGYLPVNLSGGLKAKGHPIGATGVSMHVTSAMQLTGAAPGVQLANPKIGGVFNMGGAGVANYVSILETVR